MKTPKRDEMKINLFGKMEPALEANVARRTYPCWNCPSHFNDPADYLWHIQIHQ